MRSCGIPDEKACPHVVHGDSGAVTAGVCNRGKPTDAAVRASLEAVLGTSCAVSIDDHQDYALNRQSELSHVVTSGGCPCICCLYLCRKSSSHLKRP